MTPPQITIKAAGQTIILNERPESLRFMHDVNPFRPTASVYLVYDIRDVAVWYGPANKAPDLAAALNHELTKPAPIEIDVAALSNFEVKAEK